MNDINVHTNGMQMDMHVCKNERSTTAKHTSCQKSTSTYAMTTNDDDNDDHYDDDENEWINTCNESDDNDGCR